MNKLFGAALAVIALTVYVAPVNADEYVNGYYRKDGTYVQPYHRSDADGNPYNNYSTRGNVNPYTGQPGTKSPYEKSWSNPYSAPTAQPGDSDPNNPN